MNPTEQKIIDNELSYIPDGVQWLKKHVKANLQYCLESESKNARICYISKLLNCHYMLQVCIKGNKKLSIWKLFLLFASWRNQMECQVNPTWSTRGLRQLMKLMKSNQTEEATTLIEKGEVFIWWIIMLTVSSISWSSFDLSGESWSCSLLCCSPWPASDCANSFGEGGEGRHHFTSKLKLGLDPQLLAIPLQPHWRRI